jgi:predicted HTH domain antitoxin
MSSVTLELPESVLAASQLSRDEFVREAKLLLAAKMFELGRLSSGRAAELCGMSRVEFLFAVGRLGVAIVQADEDELARELGRE